jgi:3-phosphoshikimate 1-carboxyvinyltransferase
LTAGPRRLPRGRLEGRWHAPGSKSVTNRALLAAALAEGESVLEGALASDDTRALAEALRRLGARVSIEASSITVGGPIARDPERELTFDVGAAGTPARFLLALLAATPGRFVLDGSPRLRERPMGPLVETLRSLGAEITPLGRAGFLPLAIAGGTLARGKAAIRGDVSSQFVSALLLVAPVVPGGLELEVLGPLSSAAYVTMTREVVAAFSAGRRTGYAARRYRVAGDDSAACFFLAGALVSGGRVEIAGLAKESAQPDAAFRDWAMAAGGEVSWIGDVLAVEGRGALRPLEVDVDATPDAALPLAALLAFARGRSRLTGVARLEAKESDRLGAAVDLLQRAGCPASVETGETGAPFLAIEGLSCRPRRADFLAHDDHRVAMTAAVLALALPEGSTVDAPNVVAKSNPRFWADWDALVR